MAWLPEPQAAGSTLWHLHSQHSAVHLRGSIGERRHHQIFAAHGLCISPPSTLFTSDRTLTTSVVSSQDNTTTSMMKFNIQPAFAFCVSLVRPYDGTKQNNVQPCLHQPRTVVWQAVDDGKLGCAGLSVKTLAKLECQGFPAQPADSTGSPLSFPDDLCPATCCVCSS